MIKKIQDLITGPGESFELEHRCYNGVCLAAGLGCLLASVFNPILNMPLLSTVATLIVGAIFLFLYFKSRRNRNYLPLMWLYVPNGIILLTMTWFYNGGLDGSTLLVSMVGLVAITVVLKSHRIVIVLGVFIPTVSLLFLFQYQFPDTIVGYHTVEQRFIDVYITFILSTVVILSIIITILRSHETEKKLLDESNKLLNEKIELLHRTNVELEKAVVEIKTLSGMLPICSACKSVRDDQGYWEQIESYFKQHSELEFSHSLCPDCARKLYPDLQLKKAGRTNPDKDQS